MECKLIKLLLDKEFYDVNKHRVVRTMFPEKYIGIYDTIISAHEKFTHNLSVEEIRILYKEAKPATSRAGMALIDELFNRIASEEPVHKDVAGSVLEGMWRREHARVIAEKATNILLGSNDSFSDISNYLESVGDLAANKDAYLSVTTELEDLLSVNDLSSAYRFNLVPLAALVPGLMPGRFMVISARPEVGKSLAHVSLTFAPGGFLDQGLDVVAFCNEELARYTMMRGASSYTGMTYEQIKENTALAKSEFAKIRNRIKMIDAVDLDMNALDSYVKQHKPKIVIIDQLDKVEVDGAFARTDEKLREIYTRARRIGSRYEVAIIGISQLSAEAEGRRIVSHSMAENSRTGKAAEADLFIAIGKSAQNEEAVEDDGLRYLNITKNKLNGKHGTIPCMIRPEISRLEA